MLACCSALERFEELQCFVALARHCIRVAKITERIIGAPLGEFDVFLHMRNGFVIHAFLHISLAQTSMSIGMIWLELKRSLQILNRGIILMGHIVDPSQVAQMQHGDWIKFDRAP